MIDEVRAMVEVPENMLRPDGRRGPGFGSQPTAHATEGHTDKEVVGRRDAVGAKKTILGTVGAAGWSQGERPRINRTKGRPKRAGAGVTHKLLRCVGRGL